MYDQIFLIDLNEIDENKYSFTSRKLYGIINDVGHGETDGN